MRLLAPAVCALLCAAPAFAAECEGVQMDDALTIEGRPLKLNGQGVRRKFIFDVYVAGLYVENTSTDGAAILARDEVRRVDLALLRDLDQKAIVEALKSGFEKNAGEALPGLKASLEAFIAAVPGVKKGQLLSIVYVPGKGTTVEGHGKRHTAEGKAFADALFSVWIGKYPVDEALRKALLGVK